LTIADEAFRSCTGLTGITIPNSVTSIGSKVFYNCTSLTDITVDANNMVYASEDGVLFNKKKNQLICCPAGKSDGYISSVTGSSVTSIGDYAFSGCTGLTAIGITRYVTSIGIGAFEGCTGLTSITIPNTVMYINNGAFRNCSGLTSISLPFVGSSRTANKTSDAVLGHIFGSSVTSDDNTTI
jgi:hypothetical protein